MKRFLTLASTALLSIGALSAQEAPKEEKPIKLKPYGFIRNYFYFDSRQNVQSSNGLYNQIPKDELLDVNGDDLNDVASSSFLAFTTRLGLNITGPDVLGASSSAKIESDFAGFSSSTTMLRIRQAYMKLDWKRNSLLLGQAWHPMTGELPDVLALASGSPFEPFSRSPQLRYDYRLNHFKFTLAAIYQLQYTSVGPDGGSNVYSKNAILPELFGGIEYKANGFNLGIGADFCRIAPRTTATVKEFVSPVTKDTITDAKVKVSEYVQGISPVLYASYTDKSFGIKAKTTLAENTAHLNMMSGYAVSEEKKDGSREYTPLRSSTSWINCYVGNKYRLNLFLGYSKNLGTDDKVVGDVYVKGAKNIDQIYRVAPAFSYNLKHFNLGVEYEMTTVDYGKKVDDHLEVSDTHSVTNHRICGMVKYNF